MALSPTISRQLIVISLLGALAGGTSAKPRSSLSDLEIEYAETKVTLDKMIEESQQLREKVTVAEAENAKLTESLVIAQSEAEVFRRQTGELKLRLEALGIEGAGGKASGLQERLLGVLNNLRLAEDDRKKFAEALNGTTDALSRFLKTSTTSDPEARLLLEGQVRHANELLGRSNPNVAEAAPVSATLADAMVISIKDDLNLIVANVGSRNGVKVGMPFRVLRDDKLIGTARVVDVRERYSGALIQNLVSEKEKIKLRDRLMVDADRPHAGFEITKQ
jgi:hypothetical protein